MRLAFIVLITITTLISCKKEPRVLNSNTQKVVFNQELANELEEMAAGDQIAAYIPQGKYKELSNGEWSTFKDSIFTSNQKRIEEIFNKYGFVGYDLAGKKGSDDFWIIVQHSDHLPEFQKEVLQKMKIEVDNNNANPANFGLLTDRYYLNTNQSQVYGTQVIYNKHTGQAYPKKLRDSIYVNARRQSIGLEPLEDYLNHMTKMHFEINKAYFEELGLSIPPPYKKAGH